MQHSPSFCTLVKSLMCWSRWHLHTWQGFLCRVPIFKRKAKFFKTACGEVLWGEKVLSFSCFRFSAGFPFWWYNLSTSFPLHGLKGQILKSWLLHHKLFLVRNVLQEDLMLTDLILLIGYSGLSWTIFGACIGSNSQCTLASSQCV